MDKPLIRATAFLTVGALGFIEVMPSKTLRDSQRAAELVRLDFSEVLGSGPHTHSESPDGGETMSFRSPMAASGNTASVSRYSLPIDWDTDHRS